MQSESHYIEYFFAIIFCAISVIVALGSLGHAPTLSAGDFLIAGILCIGLARLRRLNQTPRPTSPPTPPRHLT